MKKISVKLITGEHCIQGAAKNELRRLSDIILNSDDDNIHQDSGDQFVLLTEFLETADFKLLRASSESFSGAVESTCILRRDEDGKPVISVMDKKI
jgi:hypothetical protein